MRNSIVLLAAAFFGLCGALTLSVVVLGELPGERAFVATVLAERQPILTAPIQLVTFLTSAVPALIICASCAVLEVHRMGRTPRALWPLVVYFGHFACNVAMRITVGRMRPDVEYIPNLLPEISASFQQFSFPSGHAGSAVVAWGSLAITAWRTRLRTATVLVATMLIGGTSIGRIYLGVHWPSDVLGGLLLSGAWLTCGCSATLPSVSARESLRRSRWYPGSRHRPSR